ncbi:hypothetical protein PORCAN_641 [Porphyromonas crevioricanis JCM 13913]|nr:hypothetical protein PORCAN_641 [Porphyromonas crevioricanis JCM 13913]
MSSLFEKMRMKICPRKCFWRLSMKSVLLFEGSLVLFFDFDRKDKIHLSIR